MEILVKTKRVLKTNFSTLLTFYLLSLFEQEVIEFKTVVELRRQSV